jgi:LacI family transcriptional regulator
MPGVPKVALLVETARGYGRGVLRGIVRYARLHGPWAFYVTPGDFEQALPKMEQWGGTGIIACVETPRVSKSILASGLPVVAMDLSEEQLSPTSPWSRVCELTSDSEGAGRLAAEHLKDKGFRSYAFVGSAGKVWSHKRQRSFCEHLAMAGFSPQVYQGSTCRQPQWSREQQSMARWLARLPKPVGIMACDDDRGREVLEACRTARIRIPEEAAVIGVDNDELLCELSDPPLSSVALGAEQAGFEAAASLEQLMSGHAEKAGNVLARALGVVARRSTEVMLHADQEIAAALRFIHDNAGRPIRVYDVVAKLGDARRTLEIRFQNALGRSIHDEIRSARLERAKRLLLETDLPLPKVADASGFGSSSYLAVVFQKEVGQSPMKYRAKNRNRS